MKYRTLDIILIISFIWMLMTLVMGHVSHPDFTNCLQGDRTALNHCVSSQAASQPFVVIENQRYTSWSNNPFLSNQLVTREYALDDDVTVKLQRNDPSWELIKYLSFVWFCFLLGFKMLQLIKARRWNLRQTITLLFGITILFEIIAYLFPNVISYVDYGRWLIIGGLYMILIIFSVYYVQRIRKMESSSLLLGVAATAGLLITSGVTLYLHKEISFSPDSSAYYLCLAWFHRALLSIGFIALALLFISIMHTTRWPLIARLAAFIFVAVSLTLGIGVMHSPISGIMIGALILIISLLIDMTVEEKRINFLWMVVWALAISLTITLSWFALDSYTMASITELFNYFALTFIACMSLLVVMLAINSYFLPRISIAKIRLPKIYMLRHKFEIVVIGTLILSFVTIGVMTYLIEKSEQFESNRTRLSILKEGKDIDRITSTLSREIRLDSFINGIKLTQTFQEEPQFIPFEVYQHFESDSSDLVLPPYLYRLQEDQLIIRMGPKDDHILAWYNSSSLSKFMNVYVFLFLLAIGLVYLLTNHLTKPLQILGQQLYNIDLGKQNKRIEWKHNDEVGHLIDQYNIMIDQLDESAQVLAQSERDQAWREMAKQVAHEIKNPLTPMKLTIQHILMRAEKESTEFSEKVQRASNTLIEQIENLTRIANNFSQFGQMPSAANDKVRLNEVVTSVHDLFRKREDMEIRCIVPIDDLFVFADKDHMIRILNNIVKNAIQAIPRDQTGEIIIKLIRDHHNAVVSVTDNGIGIDDSQKSKVFQPNFTTKSSGTGLGLAMCSKMVESMDGRIYFETDKDIGTTFFIEIPLMRIDANYLPEAEV